MWRTVRAIKRRKVGGLDWEGRVRGWWWVRFRGSMRAVVRPMKKRVRRWGRIIVGQG